MADLATEIASLKTQVSEYSFKHDNSIANGDKIILSSSFMGFLMGAIIGPTIAPPNVYMPRPNWPAIRYSMCKQIILLTIPLFICLKF